jgi:hypothetical protein
MMAYRQHDNEKKDLKEKHRRAAGLVSERFPQVSGIVIHLTYNHKAANPVLMERTIYVSPGSYAYFCMECMTRVCENGGYDLTPVIANMIRSRNKSGKGKMVCTGENGDLPRDHASISYEVTVNYKK